MPHCKGACVPVYGARPGGGPPPVESGIGRQPPGTTYPAAWGYCSHCAAWMQWQKPRCPCCTCILRRRSRATKARRNIRLATERRAARAAAQGGVVS